MWAAVSPFTWMRRWKPEPRPPTRTPPARPPRSCSAFRGSCSTTATVISFKARSPPASAGAPAQAASLLQQQLPRFEAAGFGGFIRALQAIVAGRRDRTLADAPDLDPTMAAEILFLIETLEKPR